MEPLYTPQNTAPAYQLNWGLTLFWRHPPIPDDSWFPLLQQTTEPDGVRVVKHRITTGEASQFFISAKPRVSPSQLIRSVKGRLQHIVRRQTPKAFRRNYSVRSIGAAKRSVVEDYVLVQPARRDRQRRALDGDPGKGVGGIDRDDRPSGVEARRSTVARGGLRGSYPHDDGVPDRSPEEVALSYLNNGAYACGMKPVFQFGYYAGTIGEYDRGAV